MQADEKLNPKALRRRQSSVVQFEDLSSEVAEVLQAAELTETVAGRILAVGPRRMQRACPDLVLTIAALERMIFTYITDLLASVDWAPSWT